MNFRVFFTKSTAHQTKICFMDKIEFYAIDFSAKSAIIKLLL